MSTERSQHTFVCDFGGGVKATASIDVDALRRGKGQTQYLAVEWDGDRRQHHLPVYRAWMLTVQQRAAELLPGKILWTIKADGAWEYYKLEPGKPYERVFKPNA